MKTLINKAQKAAKKLNYIDAILWGQMLITVIIGSSKYQLIFWGMVNAVLSLSAMNMIFNTVKF